MKRPQKLNLTLSLKLILRTKTFIAVKMKLFELNSSRIEIIFQFETRELRKWLEIISQENTRKTTHYSDSRKQ